jgi:hypothetical protein
MMVVEIRFLYELNTEISTRHVARECKNFCVNPSDGEMMPAGGFFMAKWETGKEVVIIGQ